MSYLKIIVFTIYQDVNCFHTNVVQDTAGTNHLRGRMSTAPHVTIQLWTYCMLRIHMVPLPP